MGIFFLFLHDRKNHPVHKALQILHIITVVFHVHLIPLINLASAVAVTSVLQKIKAVTLLIEIVGQLMIFPEKFAEPMAYHHGSFGMFRVCIIIVYSGTIPTFTKTFCHLILQKWHNLCLHFLQIGLLRKRMPVFLLFHLFKPHM